MQVKQLYELVNQTVKETLGETVVLQEDLSNVVDVGNELFNANAVENYTRTLVDQIGKMVFVNRAYRGFAPNVLMDGWEYGSVLEKVAGDLPQVTENESWELEDGATYNPNQFYKPSVSVKFFNSKTTFEVPISITDMQIKSAFTNGVQLNAFVSMILSNVEKTMTIAMDNLIMRTINNFIGSTVYAEYAGEALNTKTGIRAINLLYSYNSEKGTALTAQEAITNPEFIRYATNQISLTRKRMQKISRIYNIGGYARFTPEDLMHIVLLDEFVAASDVYLQSDTFHNEFVKLPNAETVPYWQGSGLDYSFEQTSQVNIKTSQGNDVTVTGILGVIFDRDALGVTNLSRRTPAQRVPNAEFTNFWYKQDAGYFNDFNENFVVFFVA